MNRSNLTPEIVERAIAIAQSILTSGQASDYTNRESKDRDIHIGGSIPNLGIAPHMIIDDLIGLDGYREYMRCPDMESLATYAEESPRLAFDTALTLAQHEKRCPVCAADIADLRLTVRQQVAQSLEALPEWKSGIIGQNLLRERLNQSLVEDKFKILTLTALSGMGKTRLMLETALDQSYLFPDGVWLLPATGTNTRAGIASALADRMQLTLSPREDPFEQMCDYLHDRRAIIAWDNIDPDNREVRSALDQINSRTNGIVWITTAKKALGNQSEQAIRVDPLTYLADTTLVSSRSSQTSEVILNAESVQLFNAFAKKIVPDWNAHLRDERQLQAVGIACAHSAGNPLAIELASARLSGMSPTEIANTLTRSHSRSTTPPSISEESLNSIPTSLTKLLAWSIDMLNRRQTNLLTGITCFHDWFTAEQARTIAEEEEAHDILEQLRSHALLQRRRSSGRTSYRLMEPVSQFVQEGIAPATRGAIARKFVAYFGNLAQDLAVRCENRHQIEALQEMDDNLPHLRTAMHKAIEIEEPYTSGQIGLSMYRFLTFRGYWTECQESLLLARDSLNHANADALGHRAELELARSLITQGDFPRAVSYLDASMAGFKALEDEDGIANVQRLSGNLALFQQQYAQARTLYQTALQGFQKVGNDLAAADCRFGLGMVEQREGNLTEAANILTDVLSLLRTVGDRYRLGNLLNVLGNLAMEQQRLNSAREYFEESLRMREELGDVRGMAAAIASLGRVWQQNGDFVRAEYCYERAIRSLQRINDLRTLADLHQLMAALAEEKSDPATARRHLRVAIQLLNRVGQTQQAAEVEQEFNRIANTNT